ncbi:Uncharacterised protein [Priestia megaterium]|uniref:hypothetical protein n=1 Tax=Priestia megaterium TaxID=1404 RepID=UPI000E15AFD4|nr:hypothetical protein [Priestia megaterium]SSY69947.1 Uncharacterised protein [Priestia megaterium]
MSRREDLTGKVFGKLTAIEYVGSRKWKCKCECGEEITTRPDALKAGKTKSCGCIRKETQKKGPSKDLIGKTFGKLTVVEYAGSKNLNHMWKCKCECGEETTVRTTYLNNGHTKSCGCLRKESKFREDLTGQVFGRLTVIEYAGSKGTNYGLWKCKCECGKETISRLDTLKNGNAKSCGCLTRNGESSITHGLSKHRLYSIYENMRKRCNDPSHKAYKHYGGRGIKICEAWSNSVEAFIRDMGDSFEEGLTLERKDVNGNYSPENCKWATMIEQGSNRRNNRHITVFGEKMTVIQASRKYNINVSTLRHRLFVLKQLPENAVTLPVGKKRRREK